MTFTHEDQENIERLAPSVEHAGVMCGRLVAEHLPNARAVVHFFTELSVRRIFTFEVCIESLGR